MARTVCPDPSKKHPPSPLRHPRLCIPKSFCSCGCYCCYLSHLRRVRDVSDWQFLCCMIYYRSKVRSGALVFCDSQVDKRCHFSVREVCQLNCGTSVCLDTVKMIQITAGPEESVNSNMIHPHFLVSCELGIMMLGRRQGGGITEESESN